MQPAEREAVIAEALETNTDVGTVRKRNLPMGKKAIRPIKIKVPGGLVIVEPNKRFQSTEAALLAALEAIRNTTVAA